MTSVIRERRLAHESVHETSALMMPGDSNNLGHVFGGVILALMDKAAAVSALRHARLPVVTVSIDRVDFREPIHVGDLVILKTAVNFVGKSSIEVGVRVECEDLLTGLRRHTNTAFLTFVAIGADGNPVVVPEMICETDEERRRFAEGKERRRRRIEEATGEHPVR
jgi:acyl-CoA hydrolase